jgi:hypothetical protein
MTGMLDLSAKTINMINGNKNIAKIKIPIEISVLFTGPNELINGHSNSI